MSCCEPRVCLSIGTVLRLLGVLALAAASPAALAADATWNGGASNWNSAGNWTPAGVPDATDVDVAIDGGNTAVDSTVTLDVSVDVRSLAIDDGDALAVGDGEILDIWGGGMANDGQINLNSTGGSTANIYLRFQGSQTLGGSGEMVLSDDPNNIVRPAADAQTLTHGAGHTIRGAGKLLQGIGGMIHNGVIVAEGTNALVIDPGTPGFTNNGTLRADGGTLTLQLGTFTNTGRTIESRDGSVLNLDNINLVGGNLAAAGTGQVLAGDGTEVRGITVDAGATVDQANGDMVDLYDGLTNHGTWNLNSVGGSTAGTYLMFRGSQTLGGDGALVLSDDPNNIVRPAADDQTLTHAAGHTIEGAGQLLQGTGGMINNGTILAKGDTALVIDPGTPGFTNNGNLRAVGAGGLTLQLGTFTNTGQTIVVEDGSVLNLKNSNLVGGNLAAAGTGQILAGDGTEVRGITVDAGATVDQANGDIIDVYDGLTTHGTWNLNSVGGSTAVTYLRFQGSQTLGGDGALVLSDDPNNFVYTSADTDVLTHAAGHTIRGAGKLVANVGGMINQGTILAEGTNQLVIDPGTPGFTNEGTLRAVGAGGLQFNFGTVTNTGHTIEIADASLVNLSNANIVGGEFAVYGAGTGQVLAGNGSDLTGVTLGAGVVVDQPNGDTVNVHSGLTNNGTWNLNSIGGNTASTYLMFQGSQTLGGSGIVLMSDDPNNIVRPAADTQTVTHGASHTIQGAGQLLTNVGGMINHGTIRATGANALVINPGTPGFTSDGLIEILAGSTLNTFDTIVQTGGTTRVNGNMTVGTLFDVQGGTVGGSGTITGPIDMAGTFAPGTSIGTLTLDLLNVLDGAGYDCEIAGAASDLVHVTDTFTMDPDGAYTVHVLCSGGNVCIGPHEMLTWFGDDPLTVEEWNHLHDNATVTFTAGYDGEWEYDPAGDRMVIDITQTPEPATLALLAAGGLAALARRRRRG